MTVAPAASVCCRSVAPSANSSVYVTASRSGTVRTFSSPDTIAPAAGVDHRRPPARTPNRSRSRVFRPKRRDRAWYGACKPVHYDVSITRPLQRDAMLRTLRLVPAAMLIAAGCASTACASQVYGQRGGYYRNVDQRAYDNGYRDGIRQGTNDGRRGRNYSYNRHDEYRDADDGYRRNTGDREFYRRSYRQGFQTGYNEGYSRYGNNSRYPRSNYPNSRNYPNYPNSPDRR